MKRTISKRKMELKDLRTLCFKCFFFKKSIVLLVCLFYKYVTHIICIYSQICNFLIRYFPKISIRDLLGTYFSL